jgi:hypothetical protein
VVGVAGAEEGGWCASEAEGLAPRGGGLLRYQGSKASPHCGGHQLSTAPSDVPPTPHLPCPICQPSSHVAPEPVPRPPPPLPTPHTHLHPHRHPSTHAPHLPPPCPPPPPPPRSPTPSLRGRPRRGWATRRCARLWRGWCRRRWARRWRWSRARWGWCWPRRCRWVGQWMRVWWLWGVGGCGWDAGGGGRRRVLEAHPPLHLLLLPL